MKIFIYALLIIGFIEPVKIHAKQSIECVNKTQIDAHCFESIDSNELRQKKNNSNDIRKEFVAIGAFAVVVVGILYFNGNLFSTDTELNENKTYRVPEGESVIEHLMNLPSCTSHILSSAWFRSASNRYII